MEPGVIWRARGDLGVVKKPRHFVVYRGTEAVVDVLRVLQLPEEYLGNPDVPDPDEA